MSQELTVLYNLTPLFKDAYLYKLTNNIELNNPLVIFTFIRDGEICWYTLDNHNRVILTKAYTIDKINPEAIIPVNTCIPIDKQYKNCNKVMIVFPDTLDASLTSEDTIIFTREFVKVNKTQAFDIIRKFLANNFTESGKYINETNLSILLKLYCDIHQIINDNSDKDYIILGFNSNWID